MVARQEAIIIVLEKIFWRKYKFIFDLLYQRIVKRLAYE